MNALRKSAGWFRRLALTVLGLALLLLGVAMIVLPGPAMVLIPAGLAVLAMEYEFARRGLDSVRRVISRLARGRRLRERH